MTVGLSCLLHLGLAMTLVLGQRWVPVAIRPPILPVQLVTLDAEEPKIVPPARRPAPSSQPLRPSRVIEPPRPRKAPALTKPEPLPPPPAPLAPTPAIEPAPLASAPEPAPQPAAMETAVPGPPVATTPSPPANDAAEMTVPPAATTPRPTQTARTSMAAPEGLTQLARPQGGYQVRPSYPATPRRLGIQGTTLLRVHVLADGRIGEVRVEKSGGHPDLDQAATEAVRAWRFDPARRGAEPVAMWVLLPVEFRLK